MTGVLGEQTAQACANDNDSCLELAAPSA